MANLMTDLLNGTVDPRVGHAVCTAGARLLRVTELQYRYGKKDSAQFRLTE